MIASRERNFSDKVLYSDVNWSGKASVLPEIQKRFNEWYVEPMNRVVGTGSGFAEMALACVLVDALSQYRKGLFQSDGDAFKALLNDQITEFPALGTFHIDSEREFNGNPIILRNAASAIWQGFRCGILHEANALMCCAVDGSDNLIELIPDQTFSNYSDAAVDTVVVNPGLFRERVENIFNNYFSALASGTNFGSINATDLETNFIDKFVDSFGFRPW